MTTARRAGPLGPRCANCLGITGPDHQPQPLVGPDRTLVLIRSRLDLVKQIAHTHRATVNDVLLTVIAGGLRGLLTSRGEPVDDVLIDVPVTLRADAARAQARGNLIGQMIVPVPVASPTPVAGSRGSPRDTARLKLVRAPLMGVALHSRSPAGRCSSFWTATRSTSPAPTCPARRSRSISPALACWRCSRCCL